MTAFHSYLASPKIKRVLNRRPGEKGFSLIELVVVVAVLAILAAVAIPQFSTLSDDARLNTGKNMLVQALKECEFNKARTGTATHTKIDADAISGGTFSGTAIDASKCDDDAIYKVDNTECSIKLDLSDGKKTPETWPANVEDCKKG